MSIRQQFWAHSSDDDQCWQPLADHLSSVAELAGVRATPYGGGATAVLAGLLHDLGKYTAGFLARLHGGASVDHSTAGAQEIIRASKEVGGCEALLVSQIIAHVIAGHHAGLPDTIGELDTRLTKKLEPLSAVWRSEITPDFIAGLKLPLLEWGPDRLPYQLATYGRMIFSAVVDADFRDTEAFYARIEGLTRDRDWPSLGAILPDLICRMDAAIAQIKANASDTPLNRRRAAFMARAREIALAAPGVFSCNAPTGIGKTLATFAFALDHAKTHSKRRIIIALPYTSIIDQTADILRSIIGHDNVLEHHSNFDAAGKGWDRDQRDKLRLAQEDWAAPVIVTTNVQLFESLHSHKPSRCRRLSALAEAVIVLDEAQTIPLRVLRPCVAALGELARNYGASVVICTATQPAIYKPKFESGLPAITAERELCPEPERMARDLRRVTVLDVGEMSDADLLAELAQHDQGLVIVNSRAHALALYQSGRALGLEGLTHMTTRQCASHRRQILMRVRTALAEGRPCRLIATSLIEAGVDVDFPRLWRARAGLDQIAQAAGRCNREGRYEASESIVKIFDAPSWPMPHDLQTLAADMRSTSRSVADAKAAGQDIDLFAPSVVERYFRTVYWRKGDQRLDHFGVLDAFRASGGQLDFAYRRIGEQFRLIDSPLVPVIVPWDEVAQGILDWLETGKIPSGAAARALQPYVVQMPPSARDAMLRAAHVRFIEPPAEDDAEPLEQFAVLVSLDYYSDETGLAWENASEDGAAA